MLDYQEALIEFLAQSENLPTALEISDHIEAVKDKLQCEFWAALQNNLGERLLHSKLDHSWELLASDGSPLKDYYGCGFSQVGRRHASERCLRVHLEQSPRNSHNHLSYGICWNQKTSVDFGPSDIHSLKTKMTMEGFRAVPPWWIGIKPLDYHLRRNDFLLALVNQRQGLIDEIAELFWVYFDESRDLIMQIDTLLAQ